MKKHRDQPELVDESILEFDPKNLGLEWSRQPSLYFEYARKLMDAKNDYSEAKGHLDLVEAELDKEVRDDPELYGVKKVSERSISKTVILQSKYQDALKEVNRSRYRVDLLQAYVDAIVEKKWAMQNTLQLQINELNSEPVPPKGSGRQLGELQARSAFDMRNRRGGNGS